MKTLHVGKEDAIEITTRFLSQHCSVHVHDAVLEDKSWVVTARISMFGKIMTENIRINSTTGKIENYLLTPNIST